jgi:hypothetical protein
MEKGTMSSLPNTKRSAARSDRKQPQLGGSGSGSSVRGRRGVHAKGRGGRSTSTSIKGLARESRETKKISFKSGKYRTGSHLTGIHRAVNTSSSPLSSSTSSMHQFEQQSQQQQRSHALVLTRGEYILDQWQQMHKSDWGTLNNVNDWSLWRDAHSPIMSSINGFLWLHRSDMIVATLTHDDGPRLTTLNEWLTSHTNIHEETPIIKDRFQRRPLQHSIAIILIAHMLRKTMTTSSSSQWWTSLCGHLFGENNPLKWFTFILIGQLRPPHHDSSAPHQTDNDLLPPSLQWAHRSYCDDNINAIDTNSDTSDDIGYDEPNVSDRSSSIDLPSRRGYWRNGVMITSVVVGVIGIIATVAYLARSSSVSTHPSRREQS